MVFHIKFHMGLPPYPSSAVPVFLKGPRVKPEAILNLTPDISYQFVFILSTFLLDCGLHGVCKSHWIPNALLASRTISAMKCDLPLSDDIPRGTPDLGMISCNSRFTTSWAWLVRQGNASGHPQKVSTNTSKCRILLILVIPKNLFASNLLALFLVLNVLRGVSFYLLDYILNKSHTSLFLL